MFSQVTRFSISALLGFAALAFTASRSHAQFYGNPFFQVRPGLTLGQAAFNISTIGQALQNVPGYGMNPFMSPYAPLATSGYGNPYASMYANPYGGSYGSNYSPYMSYYDPNAGYLYGGSSAIQAQGQLMVNQQQAYLMREQVRAERNKNKRAAFDEYMYEMKNTPSPEELRQRSLQASLDRSRNSPPLTEVLSGKSLNDLLADLQKVEGKGQPAAALRTFQLPLDEEAIKHINVTKGTGNVGLLKNDGKLTWPAALSGPEFKVDRERLSNLAREVAQDASFNGRVDLGNVRQMERDADLMKKGLRRTGADLTPALYIEANRFLNDLNDALRALEQPDAVNYFNGKYSLSKALGKGNTVPELVKFMSERGLSFAPATPGDEPAYVALQQALASYDRSVRPAVAVAPEAR
jgi:hypothetical protein